MTGWCHSGNRMNERPSLAERKFRLKSTVTDPDPELHFAWHSVRSEDYSTAIIRIISSSLGEWGWNLLEFRMDFLVPGKFCSPHWQTLIKLKCHTSLSVVILLAMDGLQPDTTFLDESLTAMEQVCINLKLLLSQGECMPSDGNRQAYERF